MKCLKCHIDIIDSVFKSKDYEVCKECIDKYLKAITVVFNEVLAYANTYRSASGKSNVIESIALFYTDKELLEAKSLLLKEISCVKDPAQRRGSGLKTKNDFLQKIL